MLSSKPKSSSSSTKPVKTLSTSISREEAKTPEIETVSESRKKSSTPQKSKKKLVSSKPNGPKSSPLSSRAQRIKQSLRNKIEVSAVILKEDGTSSEVKYNGSSKQSNVILGGRPSIIGEYEELGVVVVRSLNQSQSINKTILPVPFCNKQYNGPYLLYRVDNLGNPIDLRVDEYTKFVSKNKGLTESARKAFNPIDDQQIKTKSNSLSSNTKLTLVYLRSEVDKKIRAEYEKKTGKKPSSTDIEQEVNESVQKLVDELVSSSSPMNDPDYSPSEEDESKGDDKASIISKLKQVYKQEHLGKDVNNKELLKSLENTKILLATENNPDFDDERDWRLQLNDALNYVRERGRLDGRILANKISETFYELNGAEPSLNELVDVFRRIKSELAQEAEQDLIEQGYDIKDKRDNGSAYYLAKKFGSDLSKAQPADIVDYAFRIVKEDWISRAKSVFKSTKGRLPNDNELQECVESLALKLASQAIDGTFVEYEDLNNNDYDSVADPDYDPNNVIDKRQLKEDKAEDQFDSDYFNLRMLTTESSKSSKTGKSQTYDVYFCKFSEKREARNLEQAIQTFKLRNKREPNAVEISKIKQFISTKPANNLIQFKLAVVSDDDEDNDGLRENEEKSDVLISTKRGSNKTGPTTPSKVLVTPVKKKKTSSRYNVYFGEDELDQKKSEQQALKWFKRFNHRKPNELELAGIKQFVAADKTQLKEVEYEVPVDLKGLIVGDDDKKETEEDDYSRKTLRFNEKDIIKKKNKSTKYTLNFDNEDERENGNESQAIKWFKRFNNRSPNSEEIKSIKSFVQADADENTVDID